MKSLEVTIFLGTRQKRSFGFTMLYELRKTSPDILLANFLTKSGFNGQQVEVVNQKNALMLEIPEAALFYRDYQTFLLAFTKYLEAGRYFVETFDNFVRITDSRTQPTGIAVQQPSVKEPQALAPAPKVVVKKVPVYRDRIIKQDVPAEYLVRLREFDTGIVSAMRQLSAQKNQERDAQGKSELIKKVPVPKTYNQTHTSDSKKYQELISDIKGRFQTITKKKTDERNFYDMFGRFIENFEKFVSRGGVKNG